MRIVLKSQPKVQNKNFLLLKVINYFMTAKNKRIISS